MKKLLLQDHLVAVLTHCVLSRIAQIADTFHGRFRRSISLLSLCCAAFGPIAAADELIIPAGVEFLRGVEYSNAANQHLQVNIARPKNVSGRFPAIVCIHGGGFRAGVREGYDEWCVTLASRGYVAVTVTYRLAPEFPFPAAVIDCKAAVRWLRVNARKYQVDPQRI